MHWTGEATYEHIRTGEGVKPHDYCMHWIYYLTSTLFSITILRTLFLIKSACNIIFVVKSN